MKSKIQANMQMTVALVMLLAASAAIAFAQRPRAETRRQEVQLGSGMSVIRKIETLLQAINALTHEQHTQVILLARDLEDASKPRAPIYE